MKKAVDYLKKSHRLVDNYVRAKTREENSIAPDGGASTKEFRRHYEGGKEALKRDAHEYATRRTKKK